MSRYVSLLLACLLASASSLPLASAPARSRKLRQTEDVEEKKKLVGL